MTTITITFTHPEAEQAKFTFGDRVAVIREGEPWESGKVVGLYLDELSRPKWYYTVKLDSDGCIKDCLAKDLVLETNIPQMPSLCEEPAEF